MTQLSERAFRRPVTDEDLGGLKGNQHLSYKKDTPLANLLVTMLDRAGVPADELAKLGDATGPFSEV